MKGKRVVDFLLVRPAFTQRNVSTLLLVGVFVGVYTLAGGKVTLKVPAIDTAESQFGGISGAEQKEAADKLANTEQAARVLGMKPTDEQTARDETVNARGKLFDPAVDADPNEAKLDKEGLLGNDPNARDAEEAKLRKYEKHRADSLSAIEERLNINRAGKK